LSHAVQGAEESTVYVAWEQAPWGALVAGQKGKGACNYISGI